jgi:hypothetical protein
LRRVIENWPNPRSRAKAAFHALTSDGSGGSLLSLGTDGSIDLLGVAPSALKVTNFQVG